MGSLPILPVPVIVTINGSGAGGVGVGVLGTRPLGQNVLIFMQFSGKLVK